MMRSLILAGIALATAAAATAATIAADDDSSGRGQPITVVPSPAQQPVRPPSRAATTATVAASRAAANDWWRPGVSDTWQWQLTGTIDTGYDVAIYDVDLFDAPAAVLTRLHGDGRRIICYFSAGSSENWRGDFKEFDAADLGKPLDGWAGERWLDVRSPNVRRIMAARLDLARQRGCDGVEPDNVDGYANKNGVNLTAANQLDYNRFLADAAHTRGLAIGLKNDLDQVKTLAGSFDFAVNEQCNQYRECALLKPFTAAAKPVFNAEYSAKYRNNTGGARDTLCAASRTASIRTLVLPLKLNDAYRYSCD